MKKSLIALAVAGVVSAPAFAATSNVDVYGVINIAVEDSDVANTEIQVSDRVSRIGFKGSEDLGGGLKAIWQIETGLSAATGNDGVGAGTQIANRNTFVGLAGDFGTFVMGRHDTPYKLGTGSLDPFADTIADYNGNYTVNTTTGALTAATLGMNGVDLVDSVHDHRSPSAIAYISPTVAGVHAAIAVVSTNATLLDGQNDTFDAYSATVVYANGPIFGSLSYQSANIGAGDSKAMKLGLGYTMGDAKIGFIYEDVNDSVGAGADRRSWLVNGVYNMGPIALKAEYGSVTADVVGGDVDASKLAFGVDYNMSKRTTAYAVYVIDDIDVAGVDSTKGWAVGIKHAF